MFKHVVKYTSSESFGKVIKISKVKKLRKNMLKNYGIRKQKKHIKKNLPS